MLTRRVGLAAAVAPLRVIRGICSPAPIPRPLHLLLYSYCENAIEARQPFRASHLAACTAAIQRGELLLGGALAEPVDGAILLFTTSKASEAFAQADPYVLNGVVTGWSVRQWSITVSAVKLPAIAPFEAAYEWQRIEPGVTLPPGLDVELPLDGGAQRARIPQRWQLQVWLGDEWGYLRKQVTRETTVAEIRDAAATHAGVPLSRVSLTFGGGGGEPDDDKTVEELRFFSRMHEVDVSIKAQH
uniref:YCII-related domain-containing protein n=1 Tax=Calcidiscus leptoporus TaxID=127549 RepID=A0A7S0JI27_9EUKA|mmetsp:Transcript_60065/g.137718  ORF Transcript_60065/g.137718 Transcript_60065/m.137718 type:complete len:244 (+) Transcript_60065:47-778(+)